MNQKRAFTLVATLILLAILVVIISVVAAIVSGSVRTSSAERDFMAARKSALLGLEVAIGELQGIAGPDTRVTATADVLNDPTNLYNPITVEQGRENWVGVWKSRAYDLLDADGNNVLDSNGTPILADFDITRADVREDKNGQSAFAGWLASIKDANNSFRTASEFSDITSALSDPVTLKIDENGDPALVADRIEINDDRRGQRFFAFAVEDEGVKADLTWNQDKTPTTDQTRNLRINTALGPDYDVFNSEEAVFPITSGQPIDAESDIVSNHINILRDPNDLKPLLEAEDEWLLENTTHFTIGSKAVMADVKKGGLRRDLSLAFEMDGDADFDWDFGVAAFKNPPTKFAQQFGEFVGNSLAEDVYTAVTEIENRIPRYVYGDRGDSDLVFSEDLVSGTNEQLAIHGPTWFNMRDFGNIYKRLKRDGQGYLMEARAFAPNQNWKTTGGTRHSNIDGEVVQSNRYIPLPTLESYTSSFDRFFETGGAGNRNHAERPYRANYAPVFLGMITTLSVTNSGENFAVALDPMFYLWNPYNHKLQVERYVVGFKNSSPGFITVDFESGGTTVRTFTEINDAISRAAGRGNQGGGGRITIAMDNISFEPGEVIIFSPTTDTSRLPSGTNHPFNTVAFERDADLLTIDSGVLLDRFRRSDNGNWAQHKLSSYSNIKVAYGLRSGTVDGSAISGFLGRDVNVSNFANQNDWTKLTYSTQPRFSRYGTNSTVFSNSPAFNNIQSPTHTVNYSAGSISGSKQFFGVFSLVHSPVNSEVNPTEIFAQFNPLAMVTQGNDNEERLGAWNQEGVFNTSSNPTGYGSHSEALEEANAVLPSLQEDLGNGYWGGGYDGGATGVDGIKQLSLIDVPVAPPTSLAQFANANLAVRDSAPLYAVGNSFASVFIDPESPYGQLRETPFNASIASSRDQIINVEDVSWKLNDELFDRYYLSGFASEFNITATGYNPIGTMRDTLEKFFDPDPTKDETYFDANATPVLQPYIPEGLTESEVINQLDPLLTDKGYTKMGAFSMINGAFNVNSTSVEAWSALLRANRDLDLQDGDGNDDTEMGTPFVRTIANIPDDNPYSGISRLSDEQINDLAEAIVDQVKLRGPFMSLSDFVNHRVGTPKNAASKLQTHYMGALQAAIEESGINDDIRNDAGDTEINYTTGVYQNDFNNPNPEPRPTSTGVIKDITQADLLISLAPRLTARSDTFRIRAYGEIRKDDSQLAKAICEVVVQRFPEFVSSDTNPIGEDSDPNTNEAWDDEDVISDLNRKLGRRLKVIQFRWLSPEEY